MMLSIPVPLYGGRADVGGGGAGGGDPQYGDLMLAMTAHSPDAYLTTASGDLEILDEVTGSETTKFGTHSMNFVENTSARAIKFDNPAFPVLGSSDFCIEMFFAADGEPNSSVLISRNRSSYNTQQQFSIDWNQYSNAFQGTVEDTADGVLRSQYDTDTSGNFTVAELFDGEFHHIALVRDGDDLTLYVDGHAGTVINVAGKTMKDPTDWHTYIGASSSANGDPTTGWGGLIDELRVTVGIPRYTADFTPPTAAFGRDLAGDPDIAYVQAIVSGNEADYFGRDGSIAAVPIITNTDDENPHVLPGGRFAAHAPSPDHYIAFSADATAYDLGGSDFCIELFDQQLPGTGECLVSFFDDANGKRGWSVVRAANAGLQFKYSTDGTNLFTESDTTDRTGDTALHDYCIERAGSVLRFYVDGVMAEKVTGFSPVIANPSGQLLGIGEENRVGSLATRGCTTRFKALRITRASRYDDDSGYTVPSLPFPTE